MFSFLEYCNNVATFPRIGSFNSYDEHGLDVIKKTIHYINPTQTPVVACDQPLYAISKQLQWTYPEHYGCEKMFIMFGGLHVEMAAIEAISQWLDGSGWCDALVQAKVTTQGVAESLLSANHVKRARYAHKVTAAALFVVA